MAGRPTAVQSSVSQVAAERRGEVGVLSLDSVMIRQGAMPGRVDAQGLADTLQLDPVTLVELDVAGR
jgi:hypothetical protein